MNILFPVSLDPSREDSFRLSLDVARSLSAGIRILYVVDREGIRRVESGAPPGAIHLAQEAEEEIARRESSEGAEIVAGFCRQSTDAGVSFTADVKVGNPGDEIDKAAARCDLLVAGALLHDIGKVNELAYEGAFEYTDEGRLLGHLYMGAEWVSSECGKIEGFPAEKAMLLKHLILSHHGELEYGSPKRPKTLEAVILHFVENMDAKAAAFIDAVEALPEGSRWTDYQRMFERYLFAGKPRK